MVLLIVEDEEEVHVATRFSLKRLIFEGKGLQFISAYSAAEARQLLVNNPDIAAILLEVVMESETVGLELVRYIRQDLRVYIEAWPIEKILDYINSERAAHFDPQLVDILMDNLEEFLNIRDSFPDR